MSARTGRLLLGSCLELCCFFLASFVLFFFFFFQAEDGIRDWSVTGVQTCALPICYIRRGSATPQGRSRLYDGEDRRRYVEKQNRRWDGAFLRSECPRKI